MVDLKELKALVKYLRKEGITEFKNGDLEFKLSLEQPKAKSKRIGVSSQVNDVPTDEPTREELLFWSAGDQEPAKES